MTVKITTNLIKEPSLQEIYQSVNLKMALCKKIADDHFERITPFVLCRDFLTDVLTYSIAEKQFEIYRCSFDGKNEQVNFSGVYLYFKFPNRATREIFQTQLHHLGEIETENGLPITVEWSLGDIDGLDFLVIGDKQWMQNAILFSLYTLLLRSICAILPDGLKFRQNTSTNNIDHQLLASVHPTTWEKVFANLKCIETPYFCGLDPAKHDIYEIHHNSGFISVFGTHCEMSVQTVHKNQHWKDMKEKGFTMHPSTIK